MADASPSQANGGTKWYLPAVLFFITFLSWASFSMTYVLVPSMILRGRCNILGITDTDECNKSDQAQADAADFNSIYSVLISIPTVLMTAFFGHLTDVVGRKPILLCFCLQGTAMYACLALVGLDEYWTIAIYACVSFFGATPTMTGTIFSAVADITMGQSMGARAALLGQVEAGLWLGQMFGPIAGGHIAVLFGAANAFWVSTGLSALSVVVLLLAFPETVPVERRVRLSWGKLHPLGVVPILLQQPRSLVYSLGLLLAQWGLVTGIGTWPLFCYHFFDWKNGMIGNMETLFFAANAVGLFVILRAIHKLAPPKAIIMFACTLSVIMWSLHSILRPDSGWELFLIVCLGAPAAMMYPCIRAGIAADFGPQMYGAALGTVALVQNIVALGAQPVSSKTWSWIHETSGVPDYVAFLFCAGEVLVALCVFACAPAAKEARTVTNNLSSEEPNPDKTAASTSIATSTTAAASAGSIGSAASRKTVSETDSPAEPMLSP